MSYDPPKGLRGRSLFCFLVMAQQQWIEDCERNGISYSGPRGREIRRADENELKRLQERLKSFR